MTSFMNRLKLGVIAFKEAFLTSPVVDTSDWGSQNARRMRYGKNWAWYDQTSYRNIHQWATAYRKQYALYKYIRPIYNPAYRLGEFWKTHLFGGLLDPGAGEKGAIPIFTENEALRAAIAMLWKWSRWGVQKDVLSVRGTILGDAAIRVIDDVQRGQVYLDLMYPGTIETIEKDPFGSVKGYTLLEIRDDPRGKTGTVTFEEVVSRDGDFVVWETFLNGQPYAWPENTDRTGQAVATWQEPYGFVPLVVLQHNDVGLEWGWSELHPIQAKVQEVDGIASQLSDSIAKFVDPSWLMSGTKRPESGVLVFGGADASTDRPEPGREEVNSVWVGASGKAEAMVPTLDLEGMYLHLDSLLKEIERDMLELSSDIHTASGDASGRALRVARQPVVSKALQRRMNYDAGLVAIQQMAISIGGYRGYDGYQGFNLDSYTRGDLDHYITDRPVFEEDPLDRIEVDTAFWGAAAKAVQAGVSLEAYLREAGWDDARIAELNIQEQVEREEQEDDSTD